MGKGDRNRTARRKDAVPILLSSSSDDDFVSKPSNSQHSSKFSQPSTHSSQPSENPSQPSTSSGSGNVSNNRKRAFFDDTLEDEENIAPNQQSQSMVYNYNIQIIMGSNHF